MKRPPVIHYDPFQEPSAVDASGFYGVSAPSIMFLPKSYQGCPRPKKVFASHKVPKRKPVRPFLVFAPAVNGALEKIQNPIPVCRRQSGNVPKAAIADDGHCLILKLSRMFAKSQLPES